MNKKLMEFVKREESLKALNFDDAQKYIFVRTLVLANPVIGKITSIRGLESISEELDHIKENDSRYEEDKLFCLTLAIRNVLALQLIDESCGELLRYNKDHDILNYEDSWHEGHQLVDENTLITVVNSSAYLSDGKCISLEFNLDDFLLSIATRNYTPYSVVKYLDIKYEDFKLKEKNVINRVLEHEQLLSCDIKKLLYILD